eukprot:jgi/Bigna1/75202/fgenesh1_pg.33_\
MPSSAASEQKELKRKIKDLITKRNAQQRDFDELQKFCERSEKEKKPNARTLAKKYIKTLKDASDEMAGAQSCLQELVRYVEARVAKVNKENADIWTHYNVRILAPGSKVAAYSSNMWMLAIVRNWIPARRRYDVIDGDEKQTAERRKHYILEPTKIVPLPSLTEYPLSQRRIFKPGMRVFAIYPNTTTFYGCRVMSQPKLRDHTPKYVVLFDDDSNIRRQGSIATLKHF